jgi:hypothetical protein
MSRGKTPDAPTAPAAYEARASENVDVRELAMKEMSALFTDELARRDTEWSHTVESFKEALAALERTCGAAADRLAEPEAPPDAAVSRIADKLAAAAAAEAESAAQRTHAEAQVEIARLHGLVDRAQGELTAEHDALKAARVEITRLTDLADRTQGELTAERDTLKTAREELQQEQTARKNAEAGQEKAQAIHHLVVSDLASQLQAAQSELKAARAEVTGLKHQLEAEQAERTKLVAALQTVQRAVAFADSIQPATTAHAAPIEIGEAGGARTGEVGAAGAELASLAAATQAAVEEPDASHLRLVTNPPRADTGSHPELLDYVTQLLAEMEAIYWADLRSEGNAADVVDRLAANLRYARDMFARRRAAYDVGDATLFEEQIAMLMDRKPETSFARHLAIAAYEKAGAPTNGAPRREAAS